jgi:serine phosphatase RsbU (regulator of sigma subunit)
LKGDRQPIGSHVREKPFKTQGLKLCSGYKIYLSSDGFSDQLGGSKSPKKYQSRNFKTLLGSIADRELSYQKEILLEKHMEWKGGQDQLDDILVLGLELQF